jgi:hypothetical protein
MCVLIQNYYYYYSKEKTLLLIVIRDHVGSTPLANLAKTLQADLEKIWAGLSKVKKRYHHLLCTNFHMLTNNLLA